MATRAMTALSRVPLRSGTVQLGRIQKHRFASAASGKLAKTLGSELQHEEEQYEQAKEIKAFLKDSAFKFIEKAGDVNMALEREVDGKLVRIEWQLASPFDAAADAGEEGEPEQDPTDVCVTCQSKATGAGVSFYCSTQGGEDHRYVIGNVKAFANADEQDSVSGYNGPEFEDLDDKVQEAFDEQLAEMGMSSEVCDFIDAMALDKEQREYIAWLKTCQKFFSE